MARLSPLAWAAVKSPNQSLSCHSCSLPQHSEQQPNKSSEDTLDHVEPCIKPSSIFPLCDGQVISLVPDSLASFIITCLPFLPILFLLFTLPCLF